MQCFTRFYWGFTGIEEDQDSFMEIEDNATPPRANSLGKYSIFLSVSDVRPSDDFFFFILKYLQVAGGSDLVGRFDRKLLTAY